MARKEIDNERIRRVILSAVGPHSSLREAREHGLNIIRQRDTAIELCMPFGIRSIQRFMSLPAASRVELADLEQAALMGIVEAVDSYDPRKTYNGRPIQVSTHLFWRIRKRVFEEIAANHWTIMRPPHSEINPYMQGNMTEEQRERYVELFLRPMPDPETHYFSAAGMEDEYLGWKTTRDLSQ